MNQGNIEEKQAKLSSTIRASQQISVGYISVDDNKSSNI